MVLALALALAMAMAMAMALALALAMAMAMAMALALDIIKVLSAMEAWSFSLKERLPDYLLEDLDKAVEVLTAEVLK